MLSNLFIEEGLPYAETDHVKCPFCRTKLRYNPCSDTLDNVDDGYRHNLCQDSKGKTKSLRRLLGGAYKLTDAGEAWLIEKDAHCNGVLMRTARLKDAEVWEYQHSLAFCWLCAGDWDVPEREKNLMRLSKEEEANRHGRPTVCFARGCDMPIVAFVKALPDDQVAMFPDSGVFCNGHGSGKQNDPQADRESREALAYLASPVLPVTRWNSTLHQCVVADCILPPIAVVECLDERDVALTQQMAIYCVDHITCDVAETVEDLTHLAAPVCAWSSQTITCYRPDCERAPHAVSEGLADAAVARTQWDAISCWDHAHLLDRPDALDHLAHPNCAISTCDQFAVNLSEDRASLCSEHLMLQKYAIAQQETTCPTNSLSTS